MLGGPPSSGQSGDPLSASTQSCTVCGVKIIKVVGGDRVIFSTGPAGTREVLWKKVCQHTRNLACINRDAGVRPPEF
jgi:hypothetical protein